MRIWKRFNDAATVHPNIVKAVVLDGLGQAGYRVHNDGSVTIWATERRCGELDKVGGGELPPTAERLMLGGV